MDILLSFSTWILIQAR